MLAKLLTLSKYIDLLNLKVGRFVMYGIFIMMLTLLWSSVSKTFFLPSLWTLETAQFAMVAYYMLGGAYSIQLGANVRMDLFYSSWQPTTKAWVDVFTVLCLITYLIFLFSGGLASLDYSLTYNERSPTAWRPYLWPIKIIMCIGILLMLLQAISELIKDFNKIINK